MDRIKIILLAMTLMGILICSTSSYAIRESSDNDGGGGQISISGEQTRGRGMDGKLSSNPVHLPRTGKIVGVNSTNGVGFWLECKANCGKVTKFSEFNNGNYQNWRIPPGKWAVYPNMREGLDKTNVTITIRY